MLSHPVGPFPKSTREQQRLQQQQGQQICDKSRSDSNRSRGSLASNSIDELGRQEQMEPMRQLQDHQAGRGMHSRYPAAAPFGHARNERPEETISRRAYSQMKTRIGNMVMTAAMHFAFLA